MKLIETLIHSKLKQKVSEVESWTLEWEIGNKRIVGNYYYCRN